MFYDGYNTYSDIPVRYYRKIELMNNHDKDLIIFLQNPASSANEIDRMTLFLKNYIIDYKCIHILNIIPIVSKHLEKIKIDNLSILIKFHEDNLKIIKSILESYPNSIILFACGQHFVQNKVKLRKTYKSFFLDIYKIIMDYHEKIYCLGYTSKYLKIKLDLSNKFTNLLADIDTTNKPLFPYLKIKIRLPYYPRFKKFEFIKYKLLSV